MNKEYKPLDRVECFICGADDAPVIYLVVTSRFIAHLCGFQCFKAFSDQELKIMSGALKDQS